MRVATWNLNSLPARAEKLAWWLDRAQPDVLLLQETRLPAAAPPPAELAARGYAVALHGEGGRNGVAIASRVGLDDVVSAFGDAPAPDGEARMVAARCGGVGIVCLYAPNGRELGSIHYAQKLTWFARLEGWLREGRDPAEPLVVGGDLNVAPTDADVWDPAACHGGTHVSPPERAAWERLLGWGLTDAYRARHPEGERYTWWDYRAGMFPKNFGMRIDHLLITAPLATRLVDAEIDRAARKGAKPSDHAPVLLDLDVAGPPVDAGWRAAETRFTSRRR